MTFAQALEVAEQASPMPYVAHEALQVLIAELARRDAAISAGPRAIVSDEGDHIELTPCDGESFVALPKLHGKRVALVVLEDRLNA